MADATIDAPPAHGTDPTTAGPAAAGGGDGAAAALRRLFEYPLVQALTHRRARRFSLGAEIPGGGLAYKSAQAPVPLSKREEALLTFAAAGINGMCLGDVPFAPGPEPESGGGNVMAALSGRTGASADAVHGAGLFVINDAGTSFIRRPQDFTLPQINDLAARVRRQDFEGAFDAMRVQIRPTRTTVRREVPFVFPFNKWSTNLPGTTYFLPVSDLTGMYINVILSAFDEQMGIFIVDERNNFQPAGVKKYGRSRGGRLDDNLDGNRVLPVGGLEAVVVEFLLAEQAFMVHNLSLMEQAMGLGGWTHFATATETAWFEALGFDIHHQKLTQIMGAGWLKRLLVKLTGQEREYPHARGLKFGGEYLVKPFCPPYYKDMGEAVLAYLQFKRDNAFHARLDVKPPYPGSWSQPAAVQDKIPGFSDECVAATIDYCTYLYERYGRFPANFGPLRTTLAHQAHHLDLAFYDKFYHPGAYTQTQADHMGCWH